MKKLSTEGFICSGVADLASDKVCAFAPVYSGESVGLGLAIANEPGYHLVPLNWCHGDDFEKMADHADELNMQHFGLDSKSAGNVILSSMREGLPANEVRDDRV